MWAPILPKPANASLMTKAYLQTPSSPSQQEPVERNEIATTCHRQSFVVYNLDSV